MTSEEQWDADDAPLLPRVGSESGAASLSPPIGFVPAPVLSAGRARFLDSLHELNAHRVIDLFVVIFIADLVGGALSATFSIYQHHLGRSAGIIGALVTASALAQLLLALPIGGIGDRIGFRSVISAGMLMTGVALCLSSSSSIPALAVARLMWGAGLVCTFSMASAYAARHLSGRARDASIGGLVIVQGIGYALGPVVANLTTQRIGYPGSYLAFGALAILAAGYTFVRLRGRGVGAEGPRTAGGQGTAVQGADAGQGAAATEGPIVATPDVPAARPRGRTLALVLRRDIGAISVTNLSVSAAFAGAVTPYLGLAAVGLGFGASEATLLYAARAIASVLARLVIMRFAGRWSHWQLATIAIAVDVIALGSISIVREPALLIVAAVIDGCAYGMFLTTSQMDLAARSPSHTSGAAFGVYATSGAIGNVLGGVVLTLLASHLGVAESFAGGAGLMVAGLATGLALMGTRVRLGRRPPR